MTVLTLDRGERLDEGYLLGPLPPSLTFVDESGLNPLPPSVRVTIYAAAAQQIPANVVAQGFTDVGGVLANVALTANDAYVCVFDLSREAPAVTATFAATGVSQTVVVAGYVSPVLSQAGYVARQISLYPDLWYSSDGLVPGAMPYGFAVIFGAALAAVDNLGQITQGAMRLQSSHGSNVDTWLYDFLGTYVTRFSGQSDAAWITLGMAILSLKRNVLSSIAFIVQAFYTAIQPEVQSGPQGPNLGMGVDGGMGTAGGMGIDFQNPDASLANPQITVWDKMTRPDLAALYNIAEPQFVIQLGVPNTQDLGLGMGTTGGMGTSGSMGDPPGQFALSDGAPDPRLGALVNFVKAAGTQPMYLIFHQ